MILPAPDCDCPFTQRPGQHLADRTAEGGAWCRVCQQGCDLEELARLASEQLIYEAAFLEAEESSNQDEPVSSASFTSFAHSFPALAPKALHGLAGDFVRMVEPHSEADPTALLGQFLIAFGNVTGPSPYFKVEADCHRGNLFAGLVGETSRSRKGTSHGHVRGTFESVDPDWTANRLQSGLSSGEGLIYAVRDPVERGGEFVDEGVTDKRLHIVEGEFASTFRVLGRDGNTLSPVLRNAWDGRPLRTLTKHSPCKATGAHVSVVGHITREELLRYLTDTEAANGFGNRFLWFSVRRSKCLPEGGSLSESDLRPIANRIRRAIDFGRQVGQVTRDPEAREVWANVYPKLTEDRPGLLGAMVARAEAQVTRLSLLYALLDLSGVIRREHLEAALALWDYCIESAGFIFGEQLGDPVADDILRALKRAGSEGMTRTEINSHLGRHKKSEEIGRALERLFDTRLAAFDRSETGGRPKEVWRAKEAKKAKKPPAEAAK